MIRRSVLLVTALFVVLTGFVPTLDGETPMRLPGCAVNPKVQKVLDSELNWQALDRMTFADRMALQKKTLEGLIAQYPRELAPYNELHSLDYQYAPDEWDKLREAWIRMGKEHPDDPLALLLAGKAQDGFDTPESLRLLEAARAKAPEFPWPARELAVIYASGKLADPAKAKENIDTFFALCPTSADGWAQYELPKLDPALLVKVRAARAAELRAKLEHEIDAKELQQYSALWTLEFQMRKPQDYDAERQQVARDLARMEKVHPKGDAAWQALLIAGAKQSGASKEAIAAREDRLMAEYPHSNEAYAIAYNRWDKAHPEPADQGDAAAWHEYWKADAAAAQEWIRDYPDNTFLQRRVWFFVVADDDAIPKKDAQAAVEDYVRATDIYDGPTWRWAYYPQAAQVLVERNWEPERAIELLREAKASNAAAWARDGKSDNTTEEEAKNSLNEQRERTQSLDGLLLKAAMEASRPEVAAEVRAEVEAAPPEDKKQLEGYWTNRARLAALTGNKVDALAYYQMALETRVELPKASEGKLHDDLGDEAHALWKEQGGTETAWATWSKMPAEDKSLLAQGYWEKPKKSIPDFELSDLSGKTWRMKELNGKWVLIDVWATWCGPCQAELPNLEKLYQQVKDRTDVQILTFDMDSDPGVVGPYLKDKGYTFPVLPIANAGAVADAVNDDGIPQNWVLDGSGASIWRQVGYDAENYSDFSKDMLGRIGSGAGNP